MIRQLVCRLLGHVWSVEWLDPRLLRCDSCGSVRLIQDNTDKRLGEQ